MFKLNERLSNDSALIKSLNLSQIRLIKDPDLLWFVLVPRKNDIVELTDLTIEEQKELLNEINFVINTVDRYHTYKKINLGSLGNIVSQFHFHIIFRQIDDRAWPGSIWGIKSENTFDPNLINQWKENFNE